MIARLGSGLVRVAGWTVFAVAFVWPTVSIVWHLLNEGAATTESLVPSARQWGLVLRSAGMSGAAAIIALLFSLPAAMVLSGEARTGRRTAFTALLALVLLTPPMIFSFGWDRLLPHGVPGEVRCIFIWVLWAFPIPAFLLASGWSRGGRRAYEAALLTCAPLRALLVGTRPALGRHVILSVVVLWVVFFGDYGVPHACGLIVYATEMLGWASDARTPLAVILPSVPAVGFTLLAIVLAGWLTCELDSPEGEDLTAARVHAPRAKWLAMVILIVGWGLPVAGLGLRMGSARAIVETTHTYSMDAAWSVFAAVIAGVMSMCMAWCALDANWLRRVMLGFGLVFGALPGALVGIALKATVNQPSTAWLHNHWPILSLCYVARFGWIALLATTVVAASRRSDISAQASIDGASGRRIVDRLLLPLHARLFVAAAAVIATLSLAEVAASSLLRVPAFNPIAHLIIEKFHRFEDGMLASLCLGLVAVACMSAMLLTTAAQNKVRRSAAE